MWSGREWELDVWNVGIVRCIDLWVVEVMEVGGRCVGMMWVDGGLWKGC